MSKKKYAKCKKYISISCILINPDEVIYDFEASYVFKKENITARVDLN